jgi:hypothetical protein
MLTAIAVWAFVLAGTPVTLDGYQDARWGMSKEAVNKLFPKAKPAGGTTTMLASPVEVAGGPGSATFVFDEAGLRSVNIMVGENPNAQTAAQHAEMFIKYFALLVAKYGPPDFMSEGSATRQTPWKDVKEAQAGLEKEQLGISATWTLGSTMLSVSGTKIMATTIGYWDNAHDSKLVQAKTKGL